MKKNIILISSLSATLLFILFGVFFNDFLTNSFAIIVDAIVSYFGWFYILGGFLFLVVCIYLGFSKYGKLRLGKDSDRPEYSTRTWIAMLFTAGIGVGLVFWGIAEPVSHYETPPAGEGLTAGAADTAITSSIFHWGLGVWAIYGIVALCIAYFQYRKNLPALPSSVFYPILKNKIYGPIGKTIDSYAVFMVALNTSVVLGMSAIQLTSGINYLWDVPNNFATQVIIIAIMTVLFMISTSSGVNRGMKYLSNTNMLLGCLLIVGVFLLGPSVKIINIMINSTADYIGTLLPASLRLETFAENPWIENWTIFYWAWMCAWTPFVGSFIARISKGRTIREFILGVLVAPTGIAIVWFSVMGGSAIHLIREAGLTSLIDIVNTNNSAALFAFLDYFPFSSILNIIAVIVITLFFITSADSVTYTLSMYSKNGDANPPNRLKMLWGVLFAGGSIVLIMSGGIEPMKNVVIAITFPFYILIGFMCYSIVKDVRKKKLTKQSKQRVVPIDSTAEKKVQVR
ncbi:BCCT family transporter [Gracilibacillus oryzae]|uniref:BCCT family transporter n=1 Tax=Gracilibacillus oryzae TaxID=1672701 RepID=UPI001D19182C|nr:BCCT family transporter [Gracilibacillus oryzae]